MIGSKLNPIGLAAAAVVSCVSLLLAASPERQAMGMPLAPFGWNRVIVVHVVTTLPLAWMLACVVNVRCSGWTTRRYAALWIAAGLAVAWLTVAFGDSLGCVPDAVEGGYTVRLFVRALWCLALQLPWCLAALSTAIPLRHIPLKSLLPLALLVAFVVPVGYLDRLIDEQTLLAKKHCGNKHAQEALNVVRRLCDIGSGQSLWELDVDGDGLIEKYAPRAARTILENDCTRLRGQIVALESGSKPTDWRRIQLAQMLVGLGQLAEGQSVIEPLAGRDARAAVILAQIHQQRKEWLESTRWFQKALELVQADRPSDPTEAATNEKIQVHAYNVLAHHARELDRYEAAERYYFEALARLPSRRALYHNQLGRHYELWGRPAKAAEHFTKAFELDPKSYARPNGVLQELLSTGAPVGIFRPDASNYE